MEHIWTQKEELNGDFQKVVKDCYQISYSLFLEKSILFFVRKMNDFKPFIYYMEN